MKSDYRVLRRAAAAACSSMLAFSILPVLPASAEMVTAVAPSPAERAALQAASGDPSPAAVQKPNSAKAKISKEQAVAKVKSLFPILDKAKNGSAELRTDMDTGPVWDIQWSIEGINSSYGFNSQVDATTGDLTNVYIPDSMFTDKAYYPPKLSREEARTAAEQFAAKAAPALMKKNGKLEESEIGVASLRPLFGPYGYTFAFALRHNGVPIAGNSIFISVDSEGRVTQFGYRSDQLEYPDSKPSISLEQANRKLDEEFKMELGYRPLYRNGGIESWVLSWSPSSSSLLPIDAKSGKRIGYDGSQEAAGATRYADVPKLGNAFQGNAGGELQGEAAAERVEQAGFIPQGRKLSSESLQQRGNSAFSGKEWMLRWSDPAQNKPMAGPPSESYARVDAASGQVYEFRSEWYSYGSENTKPAGGSKLTPEALKEKAIKLVNQLYPEAASRLKLSLQDEQPLGPVRTNGERFVFVPHYQGLPLDGGIVTVVMDETGKMLEYSAVPYPTPEQIRGDKKTAISEQKAKQEYQDKFNAELQYMTFGGAEGNGTAGGPQAKLVYASVPEPKHISAQMLTAAGEWVMQYETFSESQTGTLKDVEGHPAAEALRILAEHRVITPDAQGNVQPNREISAGDWLKMLGMAAYPQETIGGQYMNSSDAKAVAGVKPEDPYYQAVRTGVEFRWIGEEERRDWSAALNRDDLAVMLVSVLNYGKLSGFLGLEDGTARFTDASAIKHPGAAALAVKLGLLEAEGGAFKPEAKVTLGEAAKAIVKLAELQGKVDTPIVRER
ncbi:YcdB/YcdC domain-containing protein [Paenibacillus sp. CN-4]|uniref:YcdB/YcdC domain-containing protein n=1 Tax=Paenibacillus nanchangensis TaxID=3348343 RepID=UPI00397BBE1E